MTNCIHGCRNLETRCKDCGRVVNTAKMDDGWISIKGGEMDITPSNAPYSPFMLQFDYEWLIKQLCLRCPSDTDERKETIRILRELDKEQ